MKRLLKYMKGLYLRALTAPLFKFLEAIFELFVPICMKVIIDEGIANRDTGLVWKMSGIIALLGLLGLGFSVSSQYFSAHVSTKFASRVRSALFSHIQYLSFSDGDNIGKDTLTARLTSDTLKLQTGVNMALRLVLRSPFIVIGSTVMALTVSRASFPIFAVTILLLLIVIVLIMTLTVPLFGKMQKSLDKVIRRTGENITASRVIRAFNRKDDERLKYESAQTELYKSSVKATEISAILNPATFIIINAALLFIILMGGEGVRVGSLTSGDVVALVNYMSSILVELVKLSNLTITINKGLVSADRIADVLDVKSERELLALGEELPSGSHKIEFRNVSYRYPGASGEALSDISFTLKAGETLGIIGGTGSGKSTLASLIPGYILPTSGEILIDDRPAESFSKKSRRAATGFVTQKPAVFAGSMEDNIRFGNSEASEDDVIKAAADSCAEEFIATKEGGMSYKASQNGANLSGGQKQRLNVARAFARRAGILILDDASSALDNATEKKLRKSVANMPEKPTTVIISQRCGSVKRADVILVLEDGKCVGIGKHEELLQTSETYKEINALGYGTSDEE